MVIELPPSCTIDMPHTWTKHDSGLLLLGKLIYLILSTCPSSACLGHLDTISLNNMFLFLLLLLLLLRWLYVVVVVGVAAVVIAFRCVHYLLLSNILERDQNQISSNICLQRVKYLLFLKYVSYVEMATVTLVCVFSNWQYLAIRYRPVLVFVGAWAATESSG